MPSKNKNLHAAKRAKNDEFYTQLTDIEKEMRHYWPHFKGKVVLCNCDDPFESNFFKYFVLNFNKLGLRKLIATCYSGSPITGTQLSMFGDTESERRTPYKAIVTEVRDVTGDGAVTMDDIAELFRQGANELTRLEGDGDFRSPECLKLLDQSDIVVTNPPFSLFREYVHTLIGHDKSFIIIGNSNAITYKEIFPLIKEDKMWLGVTRQGTGSMWFKVTDDFPVKSGQKIENGVRYQTIGNSAWFTNLDIKKRHEELILVKRYKGHESEYPMYDNYAAINVDKVVDIPEDYMGAMGVPITFLGKHCPEQFEILNCNDFKRVEPSEIEREREHFLADRPHRRSHRNQRQAQVCENPYQEAMIWLPVQRLLGVRSIGASSLDELWEQVADYAGIAIESVPFSDVMGVPITFLGKHNPDQFELLGMMANNKVTDFNFGYPFVAGKRKYARVLIRRK